MNVHAGVLGREEWEPLIMMGKSQLGTYMHCTMLYSLMLRIPMLIHVQGYGKRNCFHVYGWIDGDVRLKFMALT